MFHMKEELEAQNIRDDNDLRSLVFANNPEMYQSIFGEDKEEEQPEIDVFIPQTEEEMEAFLRKLERMGFED